MKMTTWTGVIVAAALLTPLSAGAGGIFVPGTGPQAQARAGAFVAKADDPSALFHNPAGFAKGEGTVILIGANLLDFNLSVERTGAYETSASAQPWEGQDYGKVTDESSPAIGFGGFQAIPILAVTTDLGLNLHGVRLGAGVFAPNGFPERSLGADYEFEDPAVPPPPTRYDIISQEVSAAFPSVGAGYTYDNWLSVGARASFGFASVKATSNVWGIQNYEEAIDKDGYIALETHDRFVPAFGAGVLARPVRHIEIGAAYNSAATLDTRGEASSTLGTQVSDVLPGLPDEIRPTEAGIDWVAKAPCADGGIVGSLKTCAKVKLPQTASVGARYIMHDGDEEMADLEFDVKWENWSNASDLELIVNGKSTATGLNINPSVIRHGFKDTFSFRVGGSYKVPVHDDRLILRGGVAYDTAAADLEWNRADQDGNSKLTTAAGVAWQMSRVRVDLGGGYVFQPDRTVTSCVTDAANPNCPEFPVFSDPHPSPVQPLEGSKNQDVSPFNAGTYKSQYVLLSLGVTTWF